jgi:hypothetical protein
VLSYSSFSHFTAKDCHLSELPEFITVVTDFSEFFLGHSYSTYWSMKEPDRRELYLKAMPYLTFLEYSVFEAIGKNTEARLTQKDKEIGNLTQEVYWLDEELQATKEEYNKFKMEVMDMLKKRDSKIKKTD